MDKNSFIISEKNYSEAINQLETNLAELKLDKQEIMSAKLLFEETFLRLKSFSAESEDFSANIDIKSVSEI